MKMIESFASTLRRKCSAKYFFTLSVDGDSYKAAVDALNEYFSPLINLPYKRHIFRSTRQKNSETVDQYITRLRQKAETWEFGGAHYWANHRALLIRKTPFKIFEGWKNVNFTSASGDGKNRRGSWVASICHSSSTGGRN